MPFLTLQLSEDDDYKVNLFKAKNRLGTKQEAIVEMIRQVKM